TVLWGRRTGLLRLRHWFGGRRLCPTGLALVAEWLCRLFIGRRLVGLCLVCLVRFGLLRGGVLEPRIGRRLVWLLGRLGRGKFFTGGLDRSGVCNFVSGLLGLAVANPIG